MKPRHNIYIDEETSAELEALAAKPGASKSAIITDAIRHYIRHRGAHALDEALRIRLDRLTRENNLIRRDIDVLTESLAFFVRLPFGMFVTRFGRGRVSVDQRRQPEASRRGDKGDGGHGAIEARFILLHWESPVPAAPLTRARAACALTRSLAAAMA